MSSFRLSRLLNAVLLLSALVAIVAADGSARGEAGWRAAHYVAKPLATIAALLIAATAVSPVSDRYRRLLVVGLLFSLVGDVLLMLPADLFAAGLGAFLLAHLCYLRAFLGESRWLARPIALVGYGLVAITLLAAVFSALPAALRIPVIAYVVVITLMATQSAVWMLESPTVHARRAAIGAAWFLVSDATLAIARFRVDVPYRELLVLGTYYLAQWCLARSVTRGADLHATSNGVRP